MKTDRVVPELRMAMNALRSMVVVGAHAMQVGGGSGNSCPNKHDRGQASEGNEDGTDTTASQEPFVHHLTTA
jgi:hypothetical protein